MIFFKNQRKINSNGLTLVELLVVISIFLIISSVTIFNYGEFRSTVSLQNLTDDIALSVRKAQSFAIGARGVGSNFNNSYGVNFSTKNPSAGELFGSSKSFLMFSSASKMYIKPVVNAVCGDLSNACVELFGISTSDVIKEIWINDVKKIDTDATLDVVFTRPDPRASFCYRSNSDSSSCDSDTISSIKIVISNGLTLDKEKTRNISIQNTGQISMQ